MRQWIHTKEEVAEVIFCIESKIWNLGKTAILKKEKSLLGQISFKFWQSMIESEIARYKYTQEI